MKKTAKNIRSKLFYMNNTIKTDYLAGTLPARASACALVVCAALLMVSCYSSSELAGDGTEDAAADDQHHPEVMPEPPPDPTPDPNADVIIDDVPPDELPGPGITFILRFFTDVPDDEYLYAQRLDPNCHMTWVSITDGYEYFSMLDDCAICPCDPCGGCAICDECSTITVTARVGTGESISYEWDGTVYYTARCAPNPVTDALCEYPGPLAAGSYIARFCYGTGDINAYPEGFIMSPRCDDVPFTYPVPGGVVSYTVNNGG